MKIIHKYILKDILTSSLAISLVTLVLLSSNKFIRIVEKSNSTDLLSDLLLILAYNIPGYLVDILPLGFFLGTILTLSGLYANNEMTAIFAAGTSYKKVLNILLISGFVGMVFLWIVELFIAPALKEKSVDIQRAMSEVSPIDVIPDGEFFKLDPRSGAVIFAASRDKNSNLSDLFLANPADNSYFFARSAQVIEQPSTELKYFHMNDGVLALYKGDGKVSSTMEFADYSILAEPPPTPFHRLQSAAMTNTELLKTGRRWEITEFIDRVAYPPIMLTLSILAFIMSRTNPRQGRFKMVIPSILLYITFTILLSNSIRPVFREEAPYWQIYWWVHILMLALGMIYFLLTEPNFKFSKNIKK